MAKDSTENAQVAIEQNVEEEAKKLAAKILADAMADAEKIKAEAAVIPSMKTRKMRKADPESFEMIPITLPKDRLLNKDDQFAGVNGNKKIIKRGVEVRVPRYIYEDLVESIQQDAHTADLIDKKTSDAAERFKNIGE